jgi:hypothetical protein
MVVAASDEHLEAEWRFQLRVTVSRPTVLETSFQCIAEATILRLTVLKTSSQRKLGSMCVDLRRLKKLVVRNGGSQLSLG